MADYQNRGVYALSIVRIIFGWMFLWAFFDKMFGLGFETPAGSGFIDGVSPSSFAVYVADGLFKDFYLSIAGNGFVDVLMMLGMLALGVSLTLGITSRLGTIGGVAFFLIMFSMHIPPTDNPIMDYHVVYAFAIVAIYYLGGFRKLSLYDKWGSLKIVKRFPVLE